MTIPFDGIPAAPGIGQGNLYLYHPIDIATEITIPVTELVAHPDPQQEWQIFLEAQKQVESELGQVAQSLNQTAGDIFAVHKLILFDKTFTQAIRDSIFDGECSAIVAAHRAIGDMAEMLRSLDDDYFSSRAADVLDIGKRLLSRLGALSDDLPLSHIPPQSVLVAKDLTPADVAQLSGSEVQGIALADSTPTAHTSILARSLGIPLVCALGADILHARPGDRAIIDGNNGRLLVQPTAEEIRRYSRQMRSFLRQETIAAEHSHERAMTRDGRHVPVFANANNAGEAIHAADIGADGIGLLRTEYLFRGRATPPNLQEQEEVYLSIAAQLGNRLLTIRALDAGGDKPVDYMPTGPEENPFLGKRGIRLLLAYPELLRDQFRALLHLSDRTSNGKNLRFMLPMISTRRELDASRAILDEVLVTTAEREGIDLTPGNAPEIGILVEVPAAALMADRLAEKVDFFSIGTNDLAQYVLASDRTNSSVADLADPLHPAVLRMINMVCLAAQTAGIPVSLCGEVAGNPIAIPLLLGLGIDELSVPLPAVPLIKQVIRQCDLAQCRQLAQRLLTCDHVHDVRILLTEYLEKIHAG